MNAKAKPKFDPEFRMSEADFDEAMRKAFGAPPPKKEDPKPTARDPKPKRPKKK